MHGATIKVVIITFVFYVFINPIVGVIFSVFQ